MTNRQRLNDMKQLLELDLENALDHLRTDRDSAQDLGLPAVHDRLLHAIDQIQMAINFTREAIKSLKERMIKEGEEF